VLMVRHRRRREHTIAVWSVRLAADLRRAVLEEGLRRVEDFAKRHNFAELLWPGSEADFLNVNTPADFTAASRRLARSRSAPARSRSRQ
jgi:molybdopterin-guanine dinucleotide biosynthesis protein A